MLALCATFTIAACSQVTYDLPPVSLDTDGSTRSGQFIGHGLSSDDPAGSEAFYGGVGVSTGYGGYYGGYEGWSQPRMRTSISIGGRIR